MKKDMSTIKGMVSHHAKISEDQAIMAIEAVLAYIYHNMPSPVSEDVITKIINSNADSTGGYEKFLEVYTAKYGSIKNLLEARKAAALERAEQTL